MMNNRNGIDFYLVKEKKLNVIYIINILYTMFHYFILFFFITLHIIQVFCNFYQKSPLFPIIYILNLKKENNKSNLFSRIKIYTYNLILPFKLFKSFVILGLSSYQLFFAQLASLKSLKFNTIFSLSIQGTKLYKEKMLNCSIVYLFIFI